MVLFLFFLRMKHSHACPLTSRSANKGNILQGRMRWNKKPMWFVLAAEGFFFHFSVFFFFPPRDKFNGGKMNRKTHRAQMSANHMAPSRGPTAPEPSRDATWFHLPSLHLGHQLKDKRERVGKKNKKHTHKVTKKSKLTHILTNTPPSLLTSLAAAHYVSLLDKRWCIFMSPSQMMS